MSRDIRHLRVWGAACGLALALLSTPALALFIVNQPWLRPAQPGQTAELYMNLTSTEGATLVSIRCDDASSVVYRGSDKLPRALDTLMLPPKSIVALAPGKPHLALIKLNRSLVLGQRVALTLTIQNANGARQEIPVLAEVRMRSPIEEELRAHPPQHR